MPDSRRSAGRTGFTGRAFYSLGIAGRASH